MHHTRIHANSNPRQNPILHTALTQQDIFHIRIRHLGLLRQNRIILIQRQRLRIVMIWRLRFYAVDEILIEENAPVVCGLEDVDSVVGGGDDGVVAAVGEDVDVRGDAVVVAWKDGVEGYYAVDLWVRGLVQYLLLFCDRGKGENWDRWGMFFCYEEHIHTRCCQFAEFLSQR